MGVATTTDTTDSVRTSFEMLKNLYGMPVQVVETIKKDNEEKSVIFIKIIKSAPNNVIFGTIVRCLPIYIVYPSLFQHFCNSMMHWIYIK